jgi:hypothetical protein
MSAAGAISTLVWVLIAIIIIIVVVVVLFKLINLLYILPIIQNSLITHNVGQITQMHIL